jgi:hypothetical protein
MKYRFIEVSEVDFSHVQKADYEFSGLLAFIKHHLSNLFQVSFFEALHAEICSHGLLTP